MKESMNLYRTSFHGGAVGCLVAGIPEDHRNDAVMQVFVRKYPEYTGKVVLMKDAGEGVDVFGKPEKYTRHYDYEAEGGKYRKRKYSNPYAWKDAQGKKIV